MTKAANRLRIGVGLAALFVASAAIASNPQPWQLNMGPGASDISREVYWLHNMVLITCTVVGVLVFSAMGYALFKFRKSKGAVPATGFTHNTKLEAIWTIVPIIILILVSWP
ncbi:MAG: cytochrome c oxidase subunit II transmembrane domain-containing protein, partial [Rhodanobacter sp.]